MANRIFNITEGVASGDNPDTGDSVEVYRDVSIEADSLKDGYAVSRDVNVQAVQNSLHNIFSWFVGERVLDPEFGNRLYRYLYEGLTDINIEQVVAEIQNSVSKYEPRVHIEELRNVTTTDNADDNTVVIDVVYTIDGITDKKYRYRYVSDKK